MTTDALLAQSAIDRLTSGQEPTPSSSRSTPTADEGASPLKPESRPTMLTTKWSHAAGNQVGPIALASENRLVASCV